MSRESDDYAPDSIPGLSQDHPAVVRPGETAPHGEPARLSDLSGLSTFMVILEATRLRRIARDWKNDAFYPSLRERLLADYQTCTVPSLRTDIEDLLELPRGRTDTERLDWLMRQACWSRAQIDRAMDAQEQKTAGLASVDGADQAAR
jgi:hypothetical protein